MSNEVLIALISALSAIGGSLVTIVSNYLIERLTEKRKQKKEKREVLLNCYAEFIDSLQTYMNNPNILTFNKFVKSLNSIKLVGGKRVVSLASEYYVQLCTKSDKLKPRDHEYYQNEMINAMRQEILNEKSHEWNLHLIANKTKDFTDGDK